MEVILLEQVRNLGELGDVVTVKDGYARNYLIPQGVATRANKENLAVFEARRAELEAAAKIKIEKAQASADALNGLNLNIAVKATEGKLYGSLTPIDIARAIKEQHNIDVNKNEVSLPDGHIRELGEYSITLILLNDIQATIHLTVAQEQ